MLKLKNRFKIKWFAVAVVSCCILLILTHIPQEIMPKRLEVVGLDKFEHVAAYALITLLFVLSLKQPFSKLHVSILFITIIFIAVLDELTQPLVNRVASVVDFMADFVGVAAILLFSLYYRRSKRQTSPNIVLIDAKAIKETSKS